ncbi:anthranilate synthase component I [Bythopirellula polymerisocia]|uniref:Anthranilate synthase component 1 n=1 Tax=Bythopirellula polymerisocia TaxID=2528003 RepID=A0A5C6CSM5_9BACT|nr:anthranilate synthase component I [Bythopirellula polymerisocia]TWU27388.1 Anthranilate synthase component 1 [Bythopirellula polymerisocia]
MEYSPGPDRFAQLAANSDYVPVFRRLLSDALTPVQAFQRLDSTEAACLFESVIGGEKVGRYSFLASDPFKWIKAYGNQVTIASKSERGQGGATDREQWQIDDLVSEDPFQNLRDHVDAICVAHPDELPPFIGGAIGYAGYDSVRYVENLPDAPEDDRQLPDLWFALFDSLVVFDHVQKTVIVLALADVSNKDPAALQIAYGNAGQRVDNMVERLASQEINLQLADIRAEGTCSLKYSSNLTQKEYEESVRQCVEYIRAGDIFQVVISQRLETTFDAPPFELYRTLRVVNPSPFMFYLRTPEVTLVGSSPEIMVRVVEGKVTVRPLAGTRKRGHNEEEDQRLADELLADPKECAEHVMLVDLGRNDVGRVAQYGSVEISDVMVIERYSHVMHITSNVTGQLRDGCDAFDALAACLPAGTVSGAPKVRAMEIIDEIEPTRRGPYAGAVGYIDFAGNMDTCIALRTVVIHDGKAYVQAGAGIVADSVPTTEYQETLNKAQGLLKAIEITQQRLG